MHTAVVLLRASLRGVFVPSPLEWMRHSQRTGWQWTVTVPQQLSAVCCCVLSPSPLEADDSCFFHVFLPVFSKDAANFTCRAQISSPCPSLILALLLASRKRRAPEFLSGWSWTLLRPLSPPSPVYWLITCLGGVWLPTLFQLLATVRWAVYQHPIACPSNPQENKGERLGVLHLTALP